MNRKSRMIVLISAVVLTAAALSYGKAYSTEYNVKQLLEKGGVKGNRASDGDSEVSRDLLIRMRRMIASMDSVISFRPEVGKESWSRNIFRPLIVVPESSRQNEEPSGRDKRSSGEEMICNGVIISGNRALALFGKRYYQVGEALGGARIIDISMKGVVVITEGGRRREITVE